MNTKERKLLIVLAALFAVVLVLRVVPMLIGYYQSGREQIAVLQDRVERYQQLIEDTEEWKERAILKKAETEEYAHWAFEGGNPNLVGNSVQRALRQAVEQAGINIRQADLPRYSYVDDWLKVTQEMSLLLDQEEVLPFLQALKESRPRLFVTSMEITHNRRQYLGSITVTGFARAPAPAATAQGESTP